jgi:hypothetical protein
MVNAAAIEGLPEPLRSYMAARRSFLAEHASDPDTLTSTDSSERVHHFTNADLSETYPFPKLKKQFVIERRGPTARQEREGDSIWQIDAATQKLAAAWRRGDWEEADRDAVFLAHYASDLAQPLHTTVNYDGQVMRQAGIHSRFESELVNSQRERWKLQTSRARFERDVRARIFAELLTSYDARKQVYDADLEAVRGRTYLDPQYFPAFTRLAGPLAKQRLEAAAALVSSLWYTAWVRAGKPPMGGASSSQ